jgi:hypothetical protein
MSEKMTLAQALAGLPEEERIVLTLHYLKSMTSPQIATLLKVPERSVNAVITSGKARLSALLGM